MPVTFGPYKKSLRMGLWPSQYFDVFLDSLLSMMATSIELPTYERMIALALKLVRNGGQTRVYVSSVD